MTMLAPQGARSAPVKGPPNTVESVVPAEMALVRWFDEGGRAHDSLVVILPGTNVARQVWTSPASEQLLATYRPFNAQMGGAILSLLAKTKETLAAKESTPAELPSSEELLKEMGGDDPATR